MNAPARAGTVTLRTDGEDLHAQGRRRDDLALVRRPHAEERPAHRGLRRPRRGQLGARGGARAVRRRPGLCVTTSCACRTSCSSREPSLPRRPRRATASRPASHGSTTTWSDGWRSAIDSYMAEVDLPPKFVIPGGTELSAQLDIARTDPAPRGAPDRRAGRRRRARRLDRAPLREPRVGSAVRDGAVRRRARPGAVRGAGARRERGAE